MAEKGRGTDLGASRRSHLRPFNKWRKAKTPEQYLEQRSKFLENGCIEFTSSKDKDGYGQVQCARVAVELGVTRAHQLAYVTAKGPIPEGLFVCHTCDNPSCINPDHLFLGTAMDNNQDTIRKGRARYPGAPRKLTEQQYREVMEAKEGKSMKKARELAETYKIDWRTVYHYWAGRYKYETAVS